MGLKLIIQIPCFNEEGTLAIALAELPRKLPGIETVEWLIVDDGSLDNTVEVARSCGVTHVVRLPTNRGLAKAFMAGLDAALQAGADIIINTDADNQYQAADIPKLLEPILAGRAEIVIGARPIQQIVHFSPVKKFLQRLGSWVVRIASRTEIPDAPSGFRAMTREAAMRLNVFSEYTYTLETIIQAGQRGIKIESVPIRVNGELRPSRLVKSIGSYVRRSILTILRIFVVYRPFRFFMVFSALVGVPGLLIALRFLILFIQGHGQGHIQSLILAVLLMGASLGFAMIGILADLISVNRKILEDLRWRIRRMELERQ
jgi:glycosyltransferase involved in cell wall biosynthesis